MGRDASGITGTAEKGGLKATETEGEWESEQVTVARRKEKRVTRGDVLLVFGTVLNSRGLPMHLIN